MDTSLQTLAERVRAEQERIQEEQDRIDAAKAQDEALRAAATYVSGDIGS